MEEIESPDTVPSVFGPAVRIVTGHVVSSDSMVSRAYLTDAWRAVVVSDESGGIWIAGTVDALAPDTDGLRARGERNGGPPPRYARVAIVKLTVSWWSVPGDEAQHDEMHIANPRIVTHPDGAPVAVVQLPDAGVFARTVRSDIGPTPVSVAECGTLSVLHRRSGDEVYISTMFLADDGSYWPLSRRCHIASDRDGGFMGQVDGVALDLGVKTHETGSPVWSTDGSETFRGLVRPVSGDVSMLLSPSLIAETIAHARTVDRDGSSTP